MIKSKMQYTQQYDFTQHSDLLLLLFQERDENYSRRKTEKVSKIYVSKIKYKGEKRLKLVFDYDEQLIEEVKKIPGRKWSVSMKFWHIPDRLNAKQGLRSLASRNKNIQLSYFEFNDYDSQKVPQELFQYFKSYREYLIFKRYSSNTIKVYTSMLKVFFRYFNYRLPNMIENADIIRFNNNYILKNNFSFNYQNQMISAVKLFFERVDKRKVNIKEIERPRRPKKLPVVLSKQEVSRLLSTIKNIKHKAILSLIYSAGLRVGELINMKLTDIDSERGLIHIRCAKGQKDRVVNLSPIMLQMLRKYFKIYRPRKYLFNGLNSEKYSQGSIRKILKAAQFKAHIKKPIHVHTLRHSYATHMLEKGVDIRYIQDSLGHNDPKTTMIYTHVSERKINTFVNPLDDLNIANDDK